MEVFGTKKVFLFLILVAACTTIAEAKLAGDPCNATDPCDTAKGLTCNSASSLCECSDLSKQHFSLSFDECRLNEGEGCTASTECGENAFCDTNPTPNVCRCNDNSEPDTATKLCRRKTQLQCLTDADCSIVGKFMVCNSRVCGCGQNQVFNAVTQQCEVTYGGNCAAGNNTIPSCDGSTDCVSGTCNCKSPTKPNAAGSCMLPYNETCVRTDDKCDTTAFLSCDPSNKCACASSDAVYSERANACEIPAGKSCDANSGPRCTPGATCTLGMCDCPTSGSTIDGKCGCPAGYNIWNSYGNSTYRCSKKVGESCTDNSDCDPNALCSSAGLCTCASNYYDIDPISGFCFLPYDSDCQESYTCAPGLQCVSRVCECPTGETYDRQSQSCKMLLDGRCTGDDECIFGATCQMVGTSSRCACANDFQQNGTICVGTVNTACVDNTDCNAGLGLTCETKSGTCQCPADKYAFETSANRCVVRAGRNCNVTTDVCELGFSCLAWNSTVNGVPVSENVCLCDVNATGTGESKLCSGGSRAVAVTLLMAIMAAVSTYLAV